MYNKAMEDSIYTKIIKREVPAHIIYEDDTVISILTIAPVAEGHTLVIPKKQIDTLWRMSDDEYQYLMDVTKRIANHLLHTTGKDRVAMVVKGFEVPHVHVHLVPLSRSSGVSIDPEGGVKPVDFDSLAPVAEKLRFS